MQSERGATPSYGSKPLAGQRFNKLIGDIGDAHSLD